jgi:predicted  nucleic acid-binding Zn-ribbon protein
MNLQDLDLAGHPVIQQLTSRIDALEAQLRSEHEKLEKLEHEVEHDHEAIEKIEYKAAYAPPPPRPQRMTVGL